jgi:hypothetical protein
MVNGFHHGSYATTATNDQHSLAVDQQCQLVIKAAKEQWILAGSWLPEVVRIEASMGHRMSKDVTQASQFYHR